jgi:hypothetical protein
MNPNVSIILSQPLALRDALNNYSVSTLAGINTSDFDCILVSGMGLSYNAAYPVLIQLSTQVASFNLSTRRTLTFPDWQF